MLALLVLFILQPPGARAAQFYFVHPGVLQSREELERMRAAVAAKQQPIFAGFEVFRSNSASQVTYRMKGPFAEIGRSPNVHFGEFDQDANAAYQCAVMWTITGDKAYAEKAKAILNGWSTTLKRCTGADAVLMAGLGPFKLINAAEIIRYTDAGWSSADVQQCERMFREAIYPVTKDCALFANGNWDAAALKMNLSIGVFCNDRDIFERALRYYVDGAGNGRLTHYVINATGQCQESGRDQPHSQLGLALLGDCCEIAWHQGLNLYAFADNRLLKGFEYTAKYNLGGDVPFTETLDRTGKYYHRLISTNGRGRLRAVYEQIYNHYVHRAGLAAPWTQQAAEKIRPEGPGLPGADHPGFGTLFFTRPSEVGRSKVEKAPAAPAAIIAEGSVSEIKLTWIAPVNAANYTVKRAAVAAGPFATLAANLKSPEYTDRKVSAGQVYYYTVAAVNAAGASPDAIATGVCAGLPKPWAHQDVGSVAVAGGAGFDGRVFTLEGAGSDIGGTNDQFQFVYAPMNGNASIIARFVPQVSSQFSQFGLMLREQLTGPSANMSLLFAPRTGGQDVERPNWSATLASRAKAGEAAEAIVSQPVPYPYVSNGRLLEPFWLKLERNGNVFSGATSPDGRTWTQVGVVTNALAKQAFVGLTACSHLPTVTTTVRFDNVSVAAKAE